MPLSGLIVGWLGTARTVTVMTLVAAAGLVIAGLGYRVGVAPVVVGLFALGVGNGTWDVAMNVEGSAVEQALERAIMPRFHAGFSVGTVAGALIGAAMVALGVSATVHLLAVAAIVAIAGPLAVRDFLPNRPTRAPGGGRRNALSAWKEPRTVLIGVFVFTAAFTEGSGNDWLGVATIDGYGAPAVLGTLTFAGFLAAMTVGRWFGPGLIDRHGRVLTVRLFAALALAGLALVVSGAALPLAMAGAALWGLGTALGFPVGMSAAGDDPAHAPARVSVVATIGYIAFLAGPPLIGLLGQHIGTLHALTVTGGLIALGLLISGVLGAPPGPDRARAGGAGDTMRV
jgi:predicted MFS family arabinose efflux permease